MIGTVSLQSQYTRIEMGSLKVRAHSMLITDNGSSTN